MSQLSMAETVGSIEKQLSDASVEAFQLHEKLEATKLRITSLRMALGGIQLAQKTLAAEAVAHADIPA